MVSRRERRSRERQRRENEKKAKAKGTPAEALTVAPIAQAVVNEQVVANPGNGPADNQDARIQKANHEVVSKPSWLQSLRRPQNFFALWLVVFAFAQTVVGCYQWLATSDQYNAMIEQNATAKHAVSQTQETLEMMRLDQRSWLTVDASFSDAFIAGREFPLKIEITNFGKMPAIITTRIAAAILVDSKSTSKDSYFTMEEHVDSRALNIDKEFFQVVEAIAESKKGITTGTIVLPNRSFDVPLIRNTKLGRRAGTLSASDIEKIHTGEIVPVVVGYVTYTDVSNTQTRQTWACYYWDYRLQTLVQYSDYNSMN